MGTAWTFDWTDAAIAQLTELWLDGHTGGEIGRHFGVSRSAIMGKLRRLDMLRRERPSIPTMRMALRPAQNLLKIEQNIEQPPSKPPQKPKRPPKTPDRFFAEFAGKPPPPPPPSPPIGSFDLLELRNGHCRWPEGDHAPFRFCGMPQASQSSYCEEHTKRSLSGLARGTPYVGQRMARS